MVKDINEKDAKILHIYNECLQDYSKLNTIHSNITIFYCVIRNKIKKHNTSHRLKTIYIDDSTVPVFHKIPLSLFDTLPLDLSYSYQKYHDF